MKAYIFSIGETTTQLCCDQMENMGFEVVLIKNDTSLWDKLKYFYEQALLTNDSEFIRVDADIIPNRGVLDLVKVNDGCLWHCAVGWDWYKQARGSISIHHMKREAVEKCLQNIESAKDKNRPESHLWRLEEFHWPRVCHQVDISCGMHGYGQANQRDRIKDLKQSRGQDYDWDLVERIENL